MKAFTIDPENNITAYSSRKDAKQIGLPVYQTEETLADAIGNDNKRLLEIWSSLPGVASVKKFANRKLTTERIWKAIQVSGNARTRSQYRSSIPAPRQLKRRSGDAP